MTQTALHDPRHDFDFLFGCWRVRHRRLKERLAGCTEWIEFDGDLRAQPLLDGAGNVDEGFIDLPGGAYRGVTLRAFDAKTQTWAIWWLDSRDPHFVGVPMIGAFERGVGTFLCDESFRDLPIKVRFIWTATEPDAPQWAQAFSPDGGKTWETNWVMRFTRSA